MPCGSKNRLRIHHSPAASFNILFYLLIRHLRLGKIGFTGSIPVPASLRMESDNATVTLPDGFSPVSPRRYKLVQVSLREPILGRDLDKGNRLSSAQSSQRLGRDRKKRGGFLGR